MTAKTHGIDHLGLTVRDLAASVAFFTDCLGWENVGGKPNYPSVFVSDGTSVLTLWQVHNDNPSEFNRRENLGLHHVPFKIKTENALNALFQVVKDWPGIVVECAPEFSGSGPKVHFLLLNPVDCASNLLMTQDD